LSKELNDTFPSFEDFSQNSKQRLRPGSDNLLRQRRQEFQISNQMRKAELSLQAQIVDELFIRGKEIADDDPVKIGSEKCFKNLSTSGGNVIKQSSRNEFAASFENLWMRVSSIASVENG
jgi:hypothetical protein